MVTRNLGSNSSPPAIRTISNLLNASANDDLEDPPQNAIMFTPVVEWKTDPFHGKFNPGTKLGHQIFQEKTKGLAKSDILELSKTNSAAIQKFFRSKEGLMGEVIAKVPIERTNQIEQL